MLGKFSKEELEKILKIEETIVNVFEDYLKLSFENLMNKYN